MKRLALAGVLAVAIGAAGFVVHRRSPARVAKQGAVRSSDRAAHEQARFDALAGAPQAADALRGEWDRTQDAAQRVRILEAAAHVPNPSGLQLLVDVATRPHEPLAAQAASAIGHMRNPKLADDLVRTAQGDSTPLVRANAARALATSGTAAQAPALLAIVGDDGAPWRVREEAALALGRIGDDATAGALGGVLDRLAGAPGDDPLQLRIAIVQALGTLASPAAVDALQRHRARSLAGVELAFVQRALANRA